MKIRTGFVSNSSSSSFVVIGNRISLDKITAKDIKDGKIYLVEDDLYREEIDFFKATAKMISLCKTKYLPLRAYKVHKLDAGGGLLTKDDMPDEPFRIMEMDISNHHTSSLADFKNRYCQD